MPGLNLALFHSGSRYNVSLILTEKKTLDHAKYSAYSKPYMAASNLVIYGGFFARKLKSAIWRERTQVLKIAFLSSSLSVQRDHRSHDSLPP
jgi:hypothetical protein